MTLHGFLNAYPNQSAAIGEPQGVCVKSAAEGLRAVSTSKRFPSAQRLATYIWMKDHSIKMPETPGI
jgi:hypothetical protein